MKRYKVVVCDCRDHQSLAIRVQQTLNDLSESGWQLDQIKFMTPESPGPTNSGHRAFVIVNQPRD